MNRDRVADLDGCRLCGLRGDSFELREPRPVTAIEWICAFCLRARNPRQLVNHAELQHHEKTEAERGDVAQVAARNDNPIRHLPIKLLHYLNADSFLPLNSERINGIGEVKILAGSEFLDNLHAAIKIGFQRERQRAVGDRLNQLLARHLRFRQEDNRRNPGGRGIRRQGSRRIACGCAHHGANVAAIGDNLLYH